MLQTVLLMEEVRFKIVKIIFMITPKKFTQRRIDE